MDSSIVDPLVRKRTAVRSKVTKILTIVSRHDVTPLDRHDVDLYLEEFKKLEVKFYQIHDLILDQCITEQDVKTQTDVSDSFDDKLREGMKALCVIKSNFQSPPNPNVSVGSNNVTSVVKLPPMTIPTFDGSYEGWCSFEDLFVATVDKHTGISNAQKLQYLKSSVKGDAAKLIQAFQVTDENYTQAWELLRDRYNNKRDIVQSILLRMFNQRFLTKESAKDLQTLADTTSECVRSLSVLERPTDTWDDVLVFLITERMDPESRRQWTLTLKGTELPKFKDLLEFINHHVRALHASEGGKSQQRPQENVRRQAAAHHGTAEDKCKLCQNPHWLLRCPQFKALDVAGRKKFVKTSKLCELCLGSGHLTAKCNSKYRCQKCQAKHSVMLHEEKSEPVAVLAGRLDEGQVLLATAQVRVSSESGREETCRVLIDGGSQASFITDRCVKALGLRREKTDVQITGISSTSVGQAKGKVNLKLHSRISTESLQVEALILHKVTGALPKYPCQKRDWPHIKNLQLADPGFFEPGKIDILLGADAYSSLIKEGVRKGSDVTPAAQNTIFGWILSGPVSENQSGSIRIHHVTTDEILKRFWEVEELPPMSYLTEEEKAAEAHFTNTHTRDLDGRYVVKLPLKTNISDLGTSRSAAVRRLMQVEKRLASNPDHWQEYLKFMREYKELNHLELIQNSHGSPTSICPPYYLPHHFVLKTESTSTKFRVVFDGSCKSTSGISLNNALMVGPTIQDDLFTLLIRFRCHLIALKADIGKMYRQFKVAAEDCDYQRIVWRESPEDEIRDYRLLTLTYGTASAPFLATRCLKQLAIDEKTSFPLASPVLSSDMYVDDLLSGESTPERAIALRKELCGIVEKSGMKLLKWVSNHPDVIRDIPSEIREVKNCVEFDTDQTVKALGIKWNPESDNFFFEVNIQPLPSKITKRIVLSELAKVFDPLGWLAPTTIQAKILFQDLWKIQLDWDERLPDSILQNWERYQHNLIHIKNINIPRCLFTSAVVSQQLHGFSDASEKAYAAVLYLRCYQSDGSISVRLVTAKTKVAPIKQLSIPRLELCGALMLAKLITAVQNAMKIKSEIFAWTDSTIVLRWLAAFPGRWKTFVANRVAEIQDLIPTENWHHVVSEDNPADCASRGLTAEELSDFSLWWGGPEWLKHSTFPVSVQVHDKEKVEEEELKKSLVCAQMSVEESLMSRYSSLKTLERVTAYCFRFFNNSLKKNPKLVGPLSCVELQKARNCWIRNMQQSAFEKDLKELRTSGQVSRSSQLKSLCPFIDGAGLLRVGGRLQHADIPEETKHQLILPHSHLLTKLIINHYHVLSLHAGFQLLWATLQQKFWIVRARDTIRHEVRKCITCKKVRAETAQQLMGSLPSPRVNPGFPFSNTGVDYAGPFTTKVMKGRSNKTFKSYLCIFVCLATKAVHLEAVGDMTTEAFIGAFKRLSAKRGIPSHIYSDCGTNFVGAERELRELLESYNSTFAHTLADQGTMFHFNPPSAPHQGGLWEAGVKSTKAHLKRVIGSTALTYEEFQTVLSQVEACLNSRPLCPMSPDPTDLNVLTPGHFLIGRPLTAIPEPDLTSVKINRLSRWQLTQQIAQHFWRRWSAEYLSTLQQRFKWTQKREDLRIGDLVLVREDNQPQMKWKMGRVVQLFPGADSKVRVVTVKTADGEIKRPVVKLCPLMSSTQETTS